MQSGRIESPVEVQAVYERLRASVCRVIVGKDRVVELCLIALLAGGHVLLTDIPGVGKTTLARAISSSISGPSRASSSPRTCCPRTSRARASTTRGRSVSSGCRDRSSRRSCWPTRSTAPPLEPRARSSRRWPRDRSRSRERRAGPSRAVLRRCDPEPAPVPRDVSRCPRASSTALWSRRAWATRGAGGARDGARSGRAASARGGRARRGDRGDRGRQRYS